MPATRDDVVGEPPIVVPAALVLVVLNLFASQVAPVKCFTVCAMVSR